jgi:chromosome transmission fidelity protein 1
MSRERQEFPFPFTPYVIQSEFMKCLYSALQEGRLAIMESPTGTVRIFSFSRRPKVFRVFLQGKSMSLICGAFAWLKDFEEAEMRRLEAKSKLGTAEDSSDDWFNAQSQQLELKHEANLAKKALKDIQQQLQDISLYPNKLKKFKV